MKGLILAGGKGTRLRPFTFTRAKQLLPIANKPSLHYVVEDIASAGIDSIGVIVNPETGAEIKAALGDGSRWGAEFTFIPQLEPQGLAHAVRAARRFLGDDPFVMYLGDNLLSGGIRDFVQDYAAGRCDALILLTPVDNPQQFGVAVLDEAGAVLHLVEKPQDPPSNLALVGVYVFSPAVHEAIATLAPSRRGEYEITDAVQAMVDGGRTVRARLVHGWWKDTGRTEDLLDANRLVLSRLRRDIQGRVETSQLIGEVVVEEGAFILGSVVRGPVHIAAGAVVERSYLGPYTSVGPNARIVQSEVEYSILFADAQVRNLPYRLDSSVIGQGAVARGAGGGLRKQVARLVLGDISHVEL